MGKFEFSKLFLKGDGIIIPFLTVIFIEPNFYDFYLKNIKQTDCNEFKLFIIYIYIDLLYGYINSSFHFGNFNVFL